MSENSDQLHFSARRSLDCSVPRMNTTTEMQAMRNTFINLHINQG
jgi:hypothetical protein